MEQQSFGYWLKHKRKVLDLTREGLAERVGYSAATIRKIEDEERRPSAQLTERLAEIFEITQEERTAFVHFARGESRYVPREAKANSPWRASGKPPRSNVPATVTSLIGREKEIADLREYLLQPNIRLVTLIGPPGIGKTRLSIEAARAALTDFPDGVFFVALAPLDDSNLMPVTIAQSIGFVGSRNISTSEQLREGIGEKQMLLVLDNCEHLIDAVASLSSDFLSNCPHLKILATSRESLRIPGEWLYAVPAFDLPAESSSLDVETASTYPALKLFAERARAVRSDFSLNSDNLATVAAICARLDGLPLVIELIAARMRFMSPQVLLDRLSGQLVLTADGMRAAYERQRTLHHAIDWSYRLLPPEEQKLFAYLSVFSGGFALETVEAMFSQKVTEKPLSHLVALLLDKSLLKLAHDARGEARYSMLVTIQEYARERLQEMGKHEEIRNLHLSYFLELAEKADKELRGHHQLEWLGRLSVDRDNLRAALAWAIGTRQTKVALQLANNLSLFWFRRSDLNEGRQWLERVIGLPDASHFPQLYSYALAQLAFHTWLQIGAKEARPFVEQALAVASEQEDQWNTAWSLMILGLVLIHEGNFNEAQSTLEKSKALFQEIEDKWGYANAVISLALGAYLQDHWAATLALHQQALVLFRELGDIYFESVALRFIGTLHIKNGNLLYGAKALMEALILAQQLDSKFEIAMALWRFADIAQSSQQLTRAVCLSWTTKKVLDSIGAWTEGDKLKLENDLATCRAAIGESAFSEAVEQGRAMTMEQAIAYALEDQML